MSSSPLPISRRRLLAAGGIASPRSLAAVLAAGAGGAWLGTCLSASAEALTSDAGRRALVAARETDTISTRVYDIVRRLPWAERFPSRVLRNDFVRPCEAIPQLRAAVCSSTFRRSANDYLHLALTKLGCCHHLLSHAAR